MKVGIIGLGFRLGYLGYVFKAMDESFEIAGYVDPHPAGLSGLAEKGISAGTAYATPEELLDNEKLDLLMVGSPNHMHLDHIRIGLEARPQGLHRKAGRHHGRGDDGARPADGQLRA